MKYYSILLLVALSMGLAAFTGVVLSMPRIQVQQESATEIIIPEDVQLVLDRSCIPCHGPGGSGKARVKWKYEKMSDYSKSKLISKYLKIAEEVAEGKMPPEKNFKKYPERKLSDEDKDLLKKWAENAAEQVANRE